MDVRNVEMLCEKIMERAGCLYSLSEGIALLDLLASLSHYAMSTLAGIYNVNIGCSYMSIVAPSFGEEYDIYNSHHPTLLGTSKRSDATSFRSSADNNFTVVTGANMVMPRVTSLTGRVGRRHISNP
jgi:DNA mismatch repair ATPase MutS